MIYFNKKCSIDTNLKTLVENSKSLGLKNDDILHLLLLYLDYPATNKSIETPKRITNLKNKYKGFKNKIKEEILDSVKLEFKKESRYYYICSYCGLKINRPKAVTLDHFHPKHYYPEYSIYTKNLIPSCHDCNSLYKKDSINTLNIDFPYPILEKKLRQE